MFSRFVIFKWSHGCQYVRLRCYGDRDTDSCPRVPGTKFGSSFKNSVQALSCYRFYPQVFYPTNSRRRRRRRRTFHLVMGLQSSAFGGLLWDVLFSIGHFEYVIQRYMIRHESVTSILLIARNCCPNERTKLLIIIDPLLRKDRKCRYLK